MGQPVAPQDVEGVLGQGDIAILGALAPMDVDHHALAVDVADLKIEAFLKPESAGVDGEQECVVVKGGHGAEDSADFVLAEDGGQAVLFLGLDDVEGVPVAHEDVPVEEADAAIADAHGLGGPLGDVLSMDEVILKLVLGDVIGGFAIKLDEHAQGAHIGLLGAFSLAV